MAKIIPGILTADEYEYRDWLEKASGVSDLVQIDVIDGKFANNTTIGSDVIKKYHTESGLEVQLMVVDPKTYINKLKDLSYIQGFMIPFETQNSEQNLELIKKIDKNVGLSINPQTPVSSIKPLLNLIDVLCIFSASPGFSGRQLEAETYGRIKEAKSLDRRLKVEIDIGVNSETAPKLASAGADFLIATSTLKNAPDYKQAYSELAVLAKN